MKVYGKQYWHCVNRRIDENGNGVPGDPMICRRYGCPEYHEIGMDQEVEPIERCSQDDRGTLKSEKFRYIWEKLSCEHPC